MAKIKSEKQAEYLVPVKNDDDEIIERALQILDRRMRTPDNYIRSPDDIKAFARLKLTQLQHEAFAVFYLDNRHGVLGWEQMFRGTIDGASIYPREVVKAALEKNAAAVIFAHNHPSGDPSPSSADQHITRRLKDALAYVDIRVLDHLVIGFGKTVSFAELGVL